MHFWMVAVCKFSDCNHWKTSNSIWETPKFSVKLLFFLQRYESARFNSIINVFQFSHRHEAFFPWQKFINQIKMDAVLSTLTYSTPGCYHRGGWGEGKLSLRQTSVISSPLRRQWSKKVKCENTDVNWQCFRKAISNLASTVSGSRKEADLTW